MNTIWKIFIAYLGESIHRIPHQLTYITLETIDNSLAMLKLEKEKNAAFSGVKKEIHEKTIDDAIETVEEHVNKLFEASRLSKQELHEQKKQNKLIAQIVKNDYCQLLQQKGIAVV